MKRTPKISGRIAIVRIPFCRRPKDEFIADDSDRQALSKAEYGPGKRVFNRNGDHHSLSLRHINSDLPTVAYAFRCSPAA